MGTMGFLAAMVVVYAVLQVVALLTLRGLPWRIALGIAIPAAACTLVGVIGALAGFRLAPVYYLVFAPIGAACLALLLGWSVLSGLRRR